MTPLKIKGNPQLNFIWVQFTKNSHEKKKNLTSLKKKIEEFPSNFIRFMLQEFPIKIFFYREIICKIFPNFQTLIGYFGPEGVKIIALIISDRASITLVWKYV